MNRLILAGMAILAGTAIANAEPAGSIISEARLGVYYHNMEDYGETGIDLNAEILFNELPGSYGNPFLDFILKPRPHIGADLNLDGNTSFAYAGFSWTAEIFGPVFIEGVFGGALHNGETGNGNYPNRADMGCAWAFHEAVSIGVTLQDEWRVMGTLEHFSNAGLCDRNSGITNAGVRVGKLF